MIILLGENGQVAREVRTAAASQGIELRSISSQEANFLEPERVVDVLSEAPAGSVMINAAAYTQVDLAESDRDAAMQVNGYTPGAIAKVCARRNCKLIQISTDYVFPGDKQGAYQEDDATGPLGVYGASKLLGEQQVLNNLDQSIILRTSWVFSAHGKNFVKTMVRLAADRDNLSVVADQIGGPTSAKSIALTCLALADKIKGLPANSNLWGIYQYSGAPATSWQGFAQEIFRQINLPIKVNGITTDQYPTPARRPANSIMNGRKLKDNFGIAQPDWIKDLIDVLDQLGLQRATSPVKEGIPAIQSA